MNHLDPILKTLNHEIEIFLGLLKEESLALTRNDSEQLGELTHQRDYVSQNMAKHWSQLAEQLDLPADATLPALELRAFPLNNPSEDWRKLEKLTQEAARLNRINGRLIEEQMRSTQAAMQVLQSASIRSLYGSDGRLSNVLDNYRSIDSA
jgi:flagellar biosynthesis/type III secretory pathway chaperone